MIVLCNWTTSLYQRWKNCKRNIETSDHHAVSSDHKLLVAEATVKLAKRKKTNLCTQLRFRKPTELQYKFKILTSSFLIRFVLKMFRPHRILSLHGLIYFWILRCVVSHQFRYNKGNGTFQRRRGIFCVRNEASKSKGYSKKQIRQDKRRFMQSLITAGRNEWTGLQMVRNQTLKE